MWNTQWSTLLVSKSPHGFTSSNDVFKPHRVPCLPANLPIHPSNCYDFLSLTRLHRLSDRVTIVRRSKNDNPCVLKIARFSYELRALQTEIKAYGVLLASGYINAPKFIGYVYEETDERIIGFLMEYLQGRHAELDDLHLCSVSMAELHPVGIVHRDLNKYNIIVSDNKAKFIDCEAAIFQGAKWFTERKQLEVVGLAQKLADVSDTGKH